MIMSTLITLKASAQVCRYYSDLCTIIIIRADGEYFTKQLPYAIS